MGLKNTRPIAFRPKGLSDTLDASVQFQGAMAQLANLIPAPGTDMAWVCRPAAVQKTDFTGFSTPGFVSGILIVGNIAYGMIASARNSGKDEPFAYNLSTAAFLTVTGITAANSPTSPATSGDWTPPILVAVGTRIIVTHPGFAGGAIKFGWFDVSGFSDTTHTGDTHTSTLIDNLSTNAIQAGWQPGMHITGTNIPANTTIVSVASNGLSITISAATTGTTAGVALSVTGGTTASPQWAAGDTNINNLASVPVGVTQMNGRAYFLTGNSISYSDSLIPCQMTLATQVLTPGNGLPCTAIGPVPFGAPLTGGVVQALVVFQSNYAMQQITGDPVTYNLSINAVKAATGTLAPLSLCPITNGLAFVSPEGLRVIDGSAQVSPPIGDHGNGVTQPYINILHPSRACAAANADTLRISAQNGGAVGTPVQEYWYDLTRKVWSGPHSFPASLIQAWGGTFIMAASGVNAKLWQSDAVPVASSVYTENGTVLTWIWQTSLLPDNGEMAENNLSEATLALAVPVGLNINVFALDESGKTLGTVMLLVTGAAPTIWGSFVWGGALWGTAGGYFKQYRLPWPNPIVFKQMSIRVNGNSAAMTIGSLYLKYQILGYMLQAG